MATRTRKKNGEGNITKLSDNTYKVRLVYTSADGRRKDRQKRAKTLPEAERILEQFQREAEQIKKASTASIDVITLEEYVKTIFLPWKAKYLKPQSYRRIESTFIHHIFPLYGLSPLPKITSVKIQDYLEQMQRDGFSHSSVKKVHDAYSGLFRFAVNVRRDIPPQDNPTLGVMMIPEKQFTKKEIKWMTQTEISTFAKEASRLFKTGNPVYKYGTAFLFLLSTGLREAELRALNKSDVDLKNRLLYVGKSVNTVARKRIDGSNAYTKELTTPKTENSVRYVPLSEEAVSFAEEILSEFTMSDLFIHNKNGTILDSGTLHKQFNSVLRNAGLEERGLHTLRHSFVSAMYKNHVDIITIAEIIGDTPETVRKTYLHLDKAIKMQALQNINIVGTMDNNTQ